MLKTIKEKGTALKNLIEMARRSPDHFRITYLKQMKSKKF